MACVADDLRKTYIMIEPFFLGFGLGFSLILAIGAQNAFVLKAGLMRRFVLPIVLLCAASDALLIFLGVFGLGTLLEALPNLMSWIRFAGALFLFAYGTRSMISAWRGNHALDAMGDVMSLPAALFTCLALTFLNPHVYLDTVILLGGIANQSESPLGFGLGAMLASFTFFFGLGFGARLLAPFFANPRAWQILDMGIALVMWAIAYSLLASH
tara:strand:+ start:106 stop:744 length:639 start_codon:yes stop_codon:yes gene_type:complete